MKKISIIVLKYCINLIYTIFKLQKQKNRLVMLSRQSNTPSIDFKLLEQEFKKRDVEVIILCKRINKGLINKFKYCIHLVISMYCLASAKYCVIDGYSICVSMLTHKKELFVMQIWHAIGAVKKFGHQTLGTAEGRSEWLAKAANMHKNYNYITCCSESTRSIYEEAFNVPREKIKILGLPRVDYIKEKRFDKKESKDNRQIIVYIPTFRKNRRIDFNKIINSFDINKYKLIIKPHPLNSDNLSKEYITEYNIFDLINIADYIITDYSAVAFEAAIANKPIYFYTYDIEEYSRERGLNLNSEIEFPEISSRNIKEIIDNIENKKYKFDILKNFKDRYIQTLEFNNTECIVNFMLETVGDYQNEKTEAYDNRYSKEESVI